MESIAHVEMVPGHAVYILKDVDGVPVYVGYSSNVMNRLGSHALKAWWAKIATVDIEWFGEAGKSDALRRERALIERHQPAENTQYRDADSLYLQRRLGKMCCAFCHRSPGTHIYRNDLICVGCKTDYGIVDALNLEQALRDRQLDDIS